MITAESQIHALVQRRSLRARLRLVPWHFWRVYRLVRERNGRVISALVAVQFTWLLVKA